MVFVEICDMMRKLLYVFGSVLFVGSLVFVACNLAHNWTLIQSVRLDNPNLLLLSMLAYGLSHISTAMAWPLTLYGMGQPMPLLIGIKIGLVAQIGKYLPGNVAHYLGRAALASDSGVSIRTSGISTAMELLSALLAAALVACVALAINPAPLAFLHARIEDITATTIMTLLSVVTIIGAAYYIMRKGYGMKVFWGPVFYLGISFLLSGWSFSLILGAVGIKISAAAVISVFVLAWTLGFVVPGAPAGLGVREAILIAFLAPWATNGEALICAMLHRVITACIDLIAALVGYAWLTLSKKKKSANEVLSRSRISSG